METNQCECSFCKLREIYNQNSIEHIRYLKEEIQKIIKKMQENTLESIDLCYKNKHK